jgi:hypothetical protein
MALQNGTCWKSGIGSRVPLTEKTAYENSTMPNARWSLSRSSAGNVAHAIEAFRFWNKGEPEPTVTLEIGYEPHQIPISKACGLYWDCNDILPQLCRSELEYCDIYLEGKITYGAAAHRLLPLIKEEIDHLAEKGAR